MAGNKDLLKEILASQKKSSKEAKEEFTALKSGQQNITRELAEVKSQVGEVRKDVDFLQKRNDDIEKRLTALEEAGSSARNSNTYQWRQAVKYAKKVVVLNLPKGEKLPEDDKAQVKYVEEIFKNMGMNKKDIDRYKGMNIYQTDNGKANNNVNIEFESYVHATQVLRMKTWKGDDNKRVTSKIMIPNHQECYEQFTRLDNLGYEVRQVNPEFRYDIRFVGEEIILCLRPAPRRMFYSVDKLSTPQQMIEDTLEKDKRRQTSTRGRGRGGRGGKGIKRVAEVSHTMGRKEAEEVRGLGLNDNFRMMTLSSPSQQIKGQKQDLGLKQGQRLIMRVSPSDRIAATEEEDNLASFFNKNNEYDVTNMICNVDGNITTPDESPNTQGSPEEVREEVFEKQYQERIRNYTLNMKRSVVKAREKFKQNEPLIVKGGDPSPEINLDNPKYRAMFAKMNPVYYFEVKQVLLSMMKEGRTLTVGNEVSTVVMRKPHYDKQGQEEAHQFELTWDMKSKAKIVFWIYHTTFNMKVQGAKAQQWWERVMDPVYQEIVSNRAEELHRIKGLARRNIDGASAAVMGVSRIQTKLTDTGITYSAVVDGRRKVSDNHSAGEREDNRMLTEQGNRPRRLSEREDSGMITDQGTKPRRPSPAATSRSSPKSPAGAKCDVCKEGNIRKLTLCKICKAKKGHAKCVKDRVCPDCRQDPKNIKVRRKPPSQLDCTRLLQAVTHIASTVNQAEEEMIRKASTDSERDDPPIPPPPLRMSPASSMDEEMAAMDTETQETVYPVVRQGSEELAGGGEESESRQRIIDIEEEEVQTQEKQIPTPKPRRQRKQAKSAKMPAPAKEDLRVTALETKLSIISEELSYWKNIAQQHQRIDGRKRAGLEAEPSGFTVNNNMLVNMSARDIVVENIEKSTIVTRKTYPIVEPNLSHGQTEESEDKEETEQRDNREEGSLVVPQPSLL